MRPKSAEWLMIGGPARDGRDSFADMKGYLL